MTFTGGFVLIDEIKILVVSVRASEGEKAIRKMNPTGCKS
jgi:hypothetical protein